MSPEEEVLWSEIVARLQATPRRTERIGLALSRCCEAWGAIFLTGLHPDGAFPGLGAPGIATLLATRASWIWL